MHHRLDTILDAVRQDVADRLRTDAIHEAARKAGHTWRACTLCPAAVIRWFVVQVLHANTSIEQVAILAGRAFSGMAFCLARKQLPLKVFEAVLAGMARAAVPVTEAEGRWRGHRTILIDGSSFSMPDTPELQQAFGQPGGQAPGCGFPVAKILALFHAHTGLLIRVTAAPLRSHEMSGVAAIHPDLKGGDVLVGDRGFCSYAHLALLLAAGVHAVFRIHQKKIHSFEDGSRARPLRSHPGLDNVVAWEKPERRPSWMSEAEFAALPATIEVRELQYTVSHRGYRTRLITLATTLLDAAAYPGDELARLYGARWQVEVDLRNLKITMKMDIMKCKTKDGVLKELHAYAMAYNLVCLTLLESATRRGVAPMRVSFVAAYRWLTQSAPGEQIPDFPINPARPGRTEPRVRKRRTKQFSVMQEPRSVLRNRLIEEGVAA